MARCTRWTLLVPTLLIVFARAVAAPTEAPATDAERFDVWEYRILGNSVLQARDIETVVYGHLGSGKSIADVEQVRQALEGLYRDRGYGTVFVDIPEQDVMDGVVRLRVTEGRLDEVRIKGARYFSSGQIRAALPALAQDGVVNVAQLQQELAALNRQSVDRQVTPVLRAGAVPGTVDVELNVQERLPVHGSAEVNDRYTADTSRTRVNVNLSYDNLLQKFHRLSLQYQVAPENPDESRVLAATYVAPVGTSTLLAGYVVDTKSDFATVGGLGPLGILGTGRIYGLRYIRLLPDSGRMSSSFTFGVDYKDFEDVIEQPDGALDVTPMEYLNWSAVLAGTHRGDTSLTTHSVGASFGIRDLGNSPEEFAFKRYRAEPNYFYLRAEASHDRPLLLGTRLFLRASGQVAAGPLISNEQFAIGGAGSVRGYYEAEQLGDNGVFGNVEVRSPLLSGSRLQALPATYVFGFADAGVLGVLDPLPVDGEKVSRYSLSSAGVGLRMGGASGLQAELEWAYPFQSTENVDEGESRMHFQVMYGF